MRTPSPRSGENSDPRLSLMRQLTDVLASGYDVYETTSVLLDGCVEHTAVEQGGILLADADDRLQIFATTSDEVHTLELLELQADEGPCLLAYATGERVSYQDVRTERERWPRFVEASVAAGMTEVHSLPMGLRETVIGAVNLFVPEGSHLEEEDLTIVQAFATATALGILTHRELDERTQLAEQLQGALDSRVVIEQAKGILAAQAGMSVSHAFRALRAQARHERRSLADVCAEVIAGATGERAPAGRRS
ncbi:GAF and ANTAR domain-containing protein [Mobilicoccus massiliensis]|uniref:GAF and ANTAR domain-containing protein n=2 Tax=Mobilicoccus massiliensis TaxID=1522310 RepID=UPI0009E4B879|nr:GAF and ANTAR domain-containing protein [Mobilicoccus massiliensis]